MLVGVYFNGPDGSDAVRVFAQALRAQGHKVQLRDSSAWRSDCVEAFDQVVIMPSAADVSAVRAAYTVPTIDAATIEAYLAGGQLQADVEDAAPSTRSRTRKN